MFGYTHADRYSSFYLYFVMNEIHISDVIKIRARGSIVG
jgi:hypothetical protein